MAEKGRRTQNKLPQRQKQSVDLLPRERRKLVELRNRVEREALKKEGCDVPIHLGEMLRAGVIALDDMNPTQILEIVIKIRNAK
jgi:hypothetical protein